MAMSDMMGLQRPSMAAMNAGAKTTSGFGGSSQGQPDVGEGQRSQGQESSQFGQWDPIMQKTFGTKWTSLFPPETSGGNQQGAGGNANSGTGAGNNQFAAAVNMPKYQWQASPGYDWRLQEGIRGIDSSAAASGNLLSGATLKALNKYSQGIASDEYSNVFNRLGTMAGYGSSASGQSANLAMQTGQNIGQNLMAGANARGSGYINQANAYSGIGSGIMNGLMMYKLFSGAGSGAAAAK
jgi:hypothetical protein